MTLAGHAAANTSREHSLSTYGESMANLSGGLELPSTFFTGLRDFTAWPPWEAGFRVISLRHPSSRWADLNRPGSLAATVLRSLRQQPLQQS